MANQQYFEQLRIRRHELVRQIEMIDALLSEAPTQVIKASDALSTFAAIKDSMAKIGKLGPIKPEGTPKGKLSYDMYIIYLLATVFKGEQVTSTQVSDYAIKANPDIPEETVKDAIRGAMSGLAKAQRINSVVRNNRRIGNLYSAKLEDVKKFAA